MMATTALLAGGCANAPLERDLRASAAADEAEYSVDAGMWYDPASPSGPATTAPGPSQDTAPPPAPPSTEGLATGVTVREVVAAQALEARVDPVRGAVELPLIAGKPMILRALVDVTPGTPPQTVRALLEVDGETYEDTRLVGALSNAETMADAFRFELPAEAVTPTTRVGLRLLAPNGGPERQAGHPASWPLSGGVRNNEVHLTRERVEDLRRAVLAHYPVSEAQLEIEVRPTYRLDVDAPGTCTGYDWNLNRERVLPCVGIYPLLDQMTDLHTAERADMHTVYVALLSYDAETRAPPDDIMGIATGTTREDLRQGWMGLGAVVTSMDQVELGEPDYPPRVPAGHGGLPLRVSRLSA